MGECLLSLMRIEPKVLKPFSELGDEINAASIRHGLNLMMRYEASMEFLDHLIDDGDFAMGHANGVAKLAMPRTNAMLIFLDGNQLTCSVKIWKSNLRSGHALVHSEDGTTWNLCSLL